MGEFVKTKDAILAMEQVYLTRILALEIALMTCGYAVEDHIETLDEGDIKDSRTKHLELVVESLNDKDYLDRVFNEDMKNKLRSITLHLKEK